MFLSTNGILSAFTTTLLLLDDVNLSGHQIVLSVRKLKTSYTGFCMEVRRSSDNTTQNIGFVNNYLDTASLLSFVGAGSGFVKTWYDQSGNGRDYIQNTNANQPRIVNAGVLDTQNSKAALVFNSSSLASASDYILARDQSIFIVNAPAVNITAASAFTLLIDGGPNAAGSEYRSMIGYGAASVNFTNERLTYLLSAQRHVAPSGAQTYGYGQTSADILIGNYLHAFHFNGSPVQVSIKQNSILQTITTSTYSGFGTFGGVDRFPRYFKSIGGNQFNTANYFNGKIQEYILFDSYKVGSPETAVQNSINSFYTIW